MCVCIFGWGVHKPNKHTPALVQPPLRLQFSFHLLKVFVHNLAKKKIFKSAALFHFLIHILAAIIHICSSQGHKTWCHYLLLSFSFPLSHSHKTEKASFLTEMFQLSQTQARRRCLHKPEQLKRKPSSPLAPSPCTGAMVNQAGKQQTRQPMRDTYIIEKDFEGNN